MSTARLKKYCTCASCLSQILPEDKYIVCTHGSCKKAYHIDVCIGGQLPDTDELPKWVCPKCRCDAKRSMGDNSSTPATPARVIPRVPDENITQRLKKTLPPSDLKGMTSDIHLMRQEMLTLKTGMETLLTTSVRNMQTLMTSSVAKFDERIDELLGRLAISNERIASLEALHEAETASLRHQVVILQDQINKQAQGSLRNQIEIVGLPESSAENLHHVILVASKRAGVEVTSNDIDWIERAGPRQKKPIQGSSSRTMETVERQPRPVVVRFTRRAKRDEFLKAAKSRKPLMASDIGVGELPSKIFFNERLTRENRLLFREARLRAAQAGFRFCWTSNGYINIRRREGCPAIQIRSTEDLASLQGESCVVGVAVG